MNIDIIDNIIDSRYQIDKKIGIGAFSVVYSAIDTITDEDVALKIEVIKRGRSELLEQETIIYENIYQSGEFQLYKVLYYHYEEKYNILIMKRLGKSIEDLFLYCNRKFSLKTVIILVIQMIKRIEYVHSKFYLHNDIKPDNFLMGLGKDQKICYLIDYGLSNKFVDNNRVHKKFFVSDSKCNTGTLRYMSINNHLGISLSRRDDMESLGYIIIRFLRGSLPWEGLNFNNHTKEENFNIVLEMKKSMIYNDLENNYPDEITEYFRYCLSLRYDEIPDYRYLIKLFRDLFVRSKYVDDDLFDWDIAENAVKYEVSFRY